MNLFHKHLLAAGLVAGLGLSAAFAQTPPPGRQHDPATKEQRIAKMQERHAQKLAELKGKLQISPVQEPYWTAWVATLQRSPRGQRPDFAAMTTPQRIDFMQARHAERAAAMEQRADLTKRLYGVLSPAQQKVFDTETLHMGRGRHHHGPEGRGKPRG
jgi:periplasmic protein CpxP/Spy